MTEKEPLPAGIVKALGLVFGDIGTSPIYILSVVFLLTRPTPEQVIGVLSLIVWTLVILVSVEYAWLAMSLGERGEGGKIVLKTILVKLLKRSRQAAFVTLLSFIGISLLNGDGIITPAISILSAVEGLLLVPGLEHTSREALIVIACAIAIVLFAFQRKGTEKIAGRFKQELAPGLRIYEISAGYIEVISVERLMKHAGIDEKTIFYGLEDIVTQNVFWKVFAFIKRISPTFIQFHKLPSPKLHGVVTRVEI